MAISSVKALIFYLFFPFFVDVAILFSPCPLTLPWLLFVCLFVAVNLSSVLLGVL